MKLINKLFKKKQREEKHRCDECGKELEMYEIVEVGSDMILWCCKECADNYYSKEEHTWLLGKK